MAFSNKNMLHEKMGLNVKLKLAQSSGLYEVLCHKSNIMPCLGNFSLLFLFLDGTCNSHLTPIFCV